jgi:hypothetical protein
VRVVQAGHLLVPGFGIDADHVGVFEFGDEGQGVADGGEQDVAAGLVGFGFDRDPHSVALVDGVLGQQVDSFPVPVQGGSDVLGEVDFRAFTAAPENVDLCAEFSGEVDVAHDLAQRVPAHGAVVAGEAAVFEDRVTEEVGGHHRQTRPVSVSAVLNWSMICCRSDGLLPGGIRSSSWKVML